MKFAELWVDGDTLHIPPSTIDRVWTHSDRPPNMARLYPLELQRLSPVFACGDESLLYTAGGQEYVWCGPPRDRSEFWGLTRPLTLDEARRWNINERACASSRAQPPGFVRTAEPGDWLFVPGSRPVPAAPGATAKDDMRIYRGFPPTELLDMFFFAQGLK